MFGSRWKLAGTGLFGSKTTPLEQDLESDRIKQIAERGVLYPQLIDVADVHELCGALMTYYGRERDPSCEDTSMDQAAG
jgi:hypothetical protein